MIQIIKTGETFTVKCGDLYAVDLTSEEVLGECVRYIMGINTRYLRSKDEWEKCKQMFQKETSGEKGREENG